MAKIEERWNNGMVEDWNVEPNLPAFQPSVQIVYGILNYIAKEGDSVIVAKLLGAAPVGIYKMGYSLLQHAD